jgi:glucokinase
METTQATYILIGDIGGTNSRLQLAKFNGEENVEYVNTDILGSKDYKDLTSCLRKYLEPYVNTHMYPKFGVLGIAGPVFNNTVEALANLTWPLMNGNEVAKELKLEKLHLLNDFVLNGYGILSNLVEGEDYTRLNDIKPDPNGVISMIGAGTGLGHGLIIKNSNSKYHEVYPSEGGHQDFAPNGEQQYRFGEFLKKHYNWNRMEVEPTCNGPAIPLMFRFFTEVEGVTSCLSDSERKDLSSESIIKYGLVKKCKVCIKVVELFASIYGAAAGNFSLITLPTGGLYLLGGLSIALEDYLVKEDVFRNSFYNKGVCSELIKNKIPVFVVKNGLLGCKGAEVFAKRIIKS